MQARLVIVFLAFSSLQQLAYCIPKQQVKYVTYVGHKGINGEAEYITHIGHQETSLNWKQCVWREFNFGKDLGLIKECDFVKKSVSTALRVTYDGDYRLAYCTRCCNRWYFTFNDKECATPMPIEAVELLYDNPKHINIHQHRNIQGICERIPAGKIKIGFWVGKCPRHVTTPGDTYTGWGSTARFIIEEIPKPQA